MDVPEELKALPVLKLILQPLVENALFHGLKYCKCGDRILVKAWERIMLRTDQGTGLDIPAFRLIECGGDQIFPVNRENHRFNNLFMSRSGQAKV